MHFGAFHHDMCHDFAVKIQCVRVDFFRLCGVLLSFCVSLWVYFTNDVHVFRCVWRWFGVCFGTKMRHVCVCFHLVLVVFCTRFAVFFNGFWYCSCMFSSDFQLFLNGFACSSHGVRLCFALGLQCFSMGFGIAIA